MAVRKTNVFIHVDKDFFEKVFEPSREKIQKQLGTKVSQTQFSRMLFKSKINLNPKLNFDFQGDLRLRKLKPLRGKKFGIKKTKK